MTFTNALPQSPDRPAGHNPLDALPDLTTTRRVERRNHLEVWGPAPDAAATMPQPA